MRVKKMENENSIDIYKGDKVLKLSREKLVLEWTVKNALKHKCCAFCGTKDNLAIQASRKHKNLFIMCDLCIVEGLQESNSNLRIHKGGTFNKIEKEFIKKRYKLL